MNIKLATLLFLLSISLSSKAHQIFTDPVQTICYGSGETKDKAINSALRNGIEKVIGSFISSRTEIENDVLISDKIIAISQGVVVGYEIISIQNNGDQYEVSLSARISPQEIQSFLKSEGVEATFDGGLAYQNVKIEQFYEEQETEALQHFIEAWDGIPLFDYQIREVGIPFKINPETYVSRVLLGTNVSITKLDGSANSHLNVSYGWPNKVNSKILGSGYFFLNNGSGSGMPLCRYLFFDQGIKTNEFYHQNIPSKRQRMSQNYMDTRWVPFVLNFAYGLEVEIECNPKENFFSFYDALVNLLRSISLTPETVNSRKSYGYDYYPVNTGRISFYLRNERSINALLSLSDKVLEQIYGYGFKTNLGSDLPHLRQYSGLGIRPVNEFGYGHILRSVSGNGGGIKFIDRDMYLLFRSNCQGQPPLGEKIGINECPNNLMEINPPDRMVFNAYDPGYTAGGAPVHQYRLKDGKYLFQNHRVIVLLNNLEDLKDVSGFKLKANGW